MKENNAEIKINNFGYSNIDIEFNKQYKKYNFILSDKLKIVVKYDRDDKSIADYYEYMYMGEDGDDF